MQESESEVMRSERYQEEDPMREIHIKSYAQLLYERQGGTYRTEYFPGNPISPAETEQRIASIVNHNILDTVSLAATLCYLCAPKEEAPF